SGRLLCADSPARTDAARARLAARARPLARPLRLRARAPLGHREPGACPADRADGLGRSAADAERRHDVEGQPDASSGRGEGVGTGRPQRGAMRRLVAMLVLLSAMAITPTRAADQIAMSIDASKAGAKIDRNIFGQFAEHLGHGIYEGIWVGPDSAIPNTRGIRNDVVAALKALKVPNVRWPGGS